MTCWSAARDPICSWAAMAFDTADYSKDGGGAGVCVDMTSRAASDSYGNRDYLDGIERVIGTQLRRCDAWQ